MLSGGKAFHRFRGTRHSFAACDWRKGRDAGEMEGDLPANATSEQLIVSAHRRFRLNEMVKGRPPYFYIIMAQGP